jgi:hypothetical protein
MDICDGIAALKLPIQFLVQASSAGIAKDPALPKKMAAAGITMVFLGIENADEANLQQMKKGKILGVTRTAVTRLNDAGILVVAGIINGFPGDDVAAIRRNFEYVRDLGVGAIGDQMITPYPGTGMRRELIDAGMVANLYDYRWYNGSWPQGRTKHLTSKRLLFEKWKARREIIEDWRAGDQIEAHSPYFAAFYNHVVRPIIRFNENRMDLMYGVVGRYRRQMMQWARQNDYFGDMVIDERFFDPEAEGPESIGNPAAALDCGAAPLGDTGDEAVFAGAAGSGPRP